MSLLSTISKPDDRPVIATITGDAGTGKTTLGATFPKPIFMSVLKMVCRPYRQRFVLMLFRLFQKWISFGSN